MEGEKGLFSQVIDNFPYPIAIFDRNGVLSIANKALLCKAKLNADDIADHRINLLNRITNENYQVFEAVEDTFLGEATVLKNLVDPMSMFSMDDSSADSSNLKRAVFFPVIEGMQITHGAVMFMK